MSLTVSDAARLAISVLSRGWTKIEPACDASGDRRPAWHEKAVAWTTSGAIARALYETREDKPFHLLIGRFRQLHGDHPARINESLANAIARLEACVEH